MTDTPHQEPGPSRLEGRRPASRARRAASATALVASGLLAGGLLATTFSATADTAEPTPDATTEAGECRGGGRTQLDEATQASIEEAVTAAYPGASVLRGRALADGGYHVHVVTADDEQLVLTLDENFGITDELTEDELPARGAGGFGHRHGHGPGGWGQDDAPESTDDATAQTSALRL